MISSEIKLYAFFKFFSSISFFDKSCFIPFFLGETVSLFFGELFLIFFEVSLILLSVSMLLSFLINLLLSIMIESNSICWKHFLISLLFKLKFILICSSSIISSSSLSISIPNLL